MDKKIVIVLQAGKETHEGLARALHGLLYANEFKSKGYEVVIIFDGAATAWYEELTNPESTSDLLPLYKELKDSGITEIVCDFCSNAFGVKEKLTSRMCPLYAEYKGHPSVEKWIAQQYQLIII